MSKNKIAMIYIFLAVVTLLAFWQVNQSDFISFDDGVYITKNSYIQNALTIDGIIWAFTTNYQGNWHPLTWISHMLDIQLFGLNPHWHHLISLLLHITNTLLLFFVLHRMTKAPWQSAFVAALFALHPLHVESVAWVAERKDVLSTFFWMLTMGAYSYYVEHPGFRRYFFVLLFFVLGLMAKPMLVTLPFVLLLLDYWPLQRFQEIKSDYKVKTEAFKSMTSDKQKKKSKKKDAAAVKETLEVKTPADPEYKWSLIYPLFLEKIPLFALTVLSSIVTYIAQHRGGAVQSLAALNLNSRFTNAVVSYIRYIGKMIWPDNLAYFYPYPKLLQLWQISGAVLILIAITLMVFLAAKRLQYLTMGWLWYVGTLVPVIGLVQIGGQAMADRYTYIPLIGLFIMVAWGIPTLLSTLLYREKLLIALSTLTLTCFFIVSWTQVGYWQNSLTLYSRAVNVTDDNYVAYASRGSVYGNRGDYKQSIEDLDRAIKINPNYAAAYNDRATSYYALGKYKQAIIDYDMAIKINPNYAAVYNDRGNAYKNLGKYEQAIADYNKAIDINPKLASAYHNREIVYAILGNQKQAIAGYGATIEIYPKDADVYYARGNATAILGKYKQAIIDYDMAIKIHPNYAAVYNDRGNAYKNLGKYEQAIADYNRAIDINPKIADVYYNRGNAYSALGNQNQAIVNYDRAIEINPKLAPAYVNRAISYSKLGNQKQALEDIKAAAQLGNKAAQDFLKARGMSL